MRILFVCTGNTCRSPMAEAILKNKAVEGIEVKSAGVFAVDGSLASSHARTVLGENNIPEEHRSTMLSEAEITWATHIFTMTNGHKASVLAYFPEAANKTYTLMEFAAVEDSGNLIGQDVVDPFGGPLELYRQTFAEIESAIEKIINRLIREQ